MAIKVGDFFADSHPYHHASLGTDLSVIRKQAADRAKNGETVIIHHHVADDACKDREHEAAFTGGTSDRKVA